MDTQSIPTEGLQPVSGWPGSCFRSLSLKPSSPLGIAQTAGSLVGAAYPYSPPDLLLPKACLEGTTTQDHGSSP